MAAAVENILRVAARAATYNVILQVSFRLLTFLVNALVLRYVSSELLGLVNVRLTLLYSSILFLSREAFRKACLSRSNNSSTKNWRQVINLVWCCVPVGCVTGAILGWLWVKILEHPSETYDNKYSVAVGVYALCAIFELTVEPLWLIGQEFHFVHARVLIEATALAAKCLSNSYYVLFCQILVRGKQHKNTKELETAGRILSGVLKFVSLTGLIIMVFGFSYSYLALDIYGGKLLSSGGGPTLLRWYCVYVLIIAVNGITECFMFALMSKDEVDHYNHYMVAFSLVFLVASLGLTKGFGSVGFILANCINMGLRIIHSNMFIQKYFADSHQNPLLKALPSRFVSALLLLSFVITAVSESVFCCGSGWIYKIFHIAPFTAGRYIHFVQPKASLPKIIQQTLNPPSIWAAVAKYHDKSLSLIKVTANIQGENLSINQSKTAITFERHMKCTSIDELQRTYLIPDV
eukprot:gene14780-5886_t